MVIRRAVMGVDVEAKEKARSPWPVMPMMGMPKMRPMVPVSKMRPMMPVPEMAPGSTTVRAVEVPRVPVPHVGAPVLSELATWVLLNKRTRRRLRLGKSGRRHRDEQRYARYNDAGGDGFKHK